jgi:acetyltransferase-like isoleucine patch superfamily enzyme
MTWKYEKLHDCNEWTVKWKKWKFPTIIDSKMTKYGWLVQGFNVNHPDLFKLGYGVDIGHFTVIYAHCGVTIEPFVQIGPHCTILSKSTIDSTYGTVVLKRYCNIGTHSTIMPGITVGENAMIGAYSFVNTNIPDNVLAFGIPCRIQQTRKNYEHR